MNAGLLPGVAASSFTFLGEACLLFIFVYFLSSFIIKNQWGVDVFPLLYEEVCLLSIVSAFLPNSNINPKVNSTKNTIIITKP